MAGAAGDVLQDAWPGTRDYMEAELRKTAETLALISQLYERGEIDADGARFLLQLQKMSTQSVLLTAQSLGMAAVERAVNAAYGVARDAANTALGFSLL